VLGCAFAQDQFIQTGSMNFPRSGHTATLLQDGRVLIAGGDVVVPPGCITGSNSAEIYDPATGQFTLTGSLNMARVSHSAVLLDDGRVWIVGTYGGCQETNKTEFYNPSSGTFTWGPDLPVGMGASHVEWVPIVKMPDGNVLIFSGEPHNFDNRVWKFNPTTNIISEVGHTLAYGQWVLEEIGLLKTGEVALLNWPTIQPYAEIYDPATNTSRAVANIPSGLPRWGASSVVLNDGRWVIFGGTSADWQSYMPLVIYDPATDAFRQVGDTLYQANGEPNGVALHDGRALFGASSCGSGTFYIFDSLDDSMHQREH
jgi:hypothetical protein